MHIKAHLHKLYQERGSSHKLGTLKTLISYIAKVEMDKCCKSTDTEGEREGNKRGR